MFICDMKSYQFIYFLVLYQLIYTGETKENTEEINERHKRATRNCHQKFKAIPGHTACLPRSSEAFDTGVSEEDKKRILDLHNNARSTVNPPAVAMLKMSWDDEVAQIAQAWAENCGGLAHDKWYHRFIPGRFSVGQNLAWGWGSPKQTWEGAIDGWHEELKLFTYGGRNSGKVGHYTQMVWENSTKLGCGYAQCGGRYTFVCNYAPAGNLNINYPYRTGQPGALCPKSRKNNLCDCGNHVCLNGAVTDVNSCTCTCQKYIHYVGDYCALDCDLMKEDTYCGSFYQKQDCTRYSNYPYMCPGLCGMCPYGGIAFATIEETEYGIIDSTTKRNNGGTGNDAGDGTSNATILYRSLPAVFILLILISLVI